MTINRIELMKKNFISLPCRSTHLHWFPITRIPSNSILVTKLNGSIYILVQEIMY